MQQQEREQEEGKPLMQTDNDARASTYGQSVWEETPIYFDKNAALMQTDNDARASTYGQSVWNAAAALYDRYAQSIFAYIRLHTVSREDAEDLLLEVFLAVFEQQNLFGLSEKEQLAWLRRVASNKLVDIYRQASRHPSISLDKVEETIYDDERRSPESVTLRQEAYGELHAAICMLPSLQQRVLRLRFGSGLRFSEIAVLLNKREEAVRKLLSRTLATLRSIYHQDHV